MAAPKIPLARQSSGTRTFTSGQQGTMHLPNPYDWLEDPSSSETTSFVETQNAAFVEYLKDDSLGEAKQQLIKNLMDKWKLAIMPSLPQVVGNEYVVRALGQGREFRMTYRIPKSAVLGHEGPQEYNETDIPNEKVTKFEIFHDEAAYAAVLMASAPSRTGKYWAFTTSDAGSDWGIIRIKDVETGTVLADEIRGSKFSSKPSSVIPWLGDRGFFYPYYPAGRAGGKAPGRAQLRFHEIGRPQEVDEVVYEDAERPGYTFKAAISQDDSFVFLEVYDQGRGCEVWAATVNGHEAGESGTVSGGSRRLNLKFTRKVSGQSDAEREYVPVFPL